MDTESSARQYLDVLRGQLAGYRREQDPEEAQAQDTAALQGDHEMIWGPGGDFVRAIARLLAEADVTEAQPAESVMTSEEGEV